MVGIPALPIIPEPVLRMVSGLLGIDKAKAEQFVSDVHSVAAELIGTQKGIVASQERALAEIAALHIKINALTSGNDAAAFREAAE